MAAFASSLDFEGKVGRDYPAYFERDDPLNPIQVQGVLLKNMAVGVFSYFEIASKTGMDKEVVRDFLKSIGGGHNGITVRSDKSV